MNPGARCVDIAVVCSESRFIIINAGRTVTDVTIFICAAIGTVTVGTGSIGVTGISRKTLVDVSTCFTIAVEVFITGAGV